MNLQMQNISYSDIRSRVLGADFYPFQPGDKNGPRISYMHFFIYINKGSGTIVIDGVNYSAAERDLFYVEPGVVHSFCADRYDPMVFASVYVDFLWNSSPKSKGDLALNCYFKRETYVPQLSASKIRFNENITIPAKTTVPINASWVEPFLSVIHRFDDNGPDAEIRLRSLFELFFTDFVHYLAHPYVPNDLRIRKLIQWMETHLQASFSIAEWAERLNISQAYLYELFHKETGVSPQQYWMRCRLEQAKKELRETNLSITLIADKYGFSSIHYFSRQYASQYQESPSQYRKRIRVFGTPQRSS